MEEREVKERRESGENRSKSVRDTEEGFDVE